MAQIDIRIEMAEPFLVGSRKLGTVTETLGYLPGSVLRGVVAETLLRQWPEEERSVPHPDHCPDRAKCAFCRLFYPEHGPEPRFGNLYPTSGDTAHPFPTTARTCKYHPGFRRDDDDPDERHGIFDILIREYAFKQALESRKALPFLYRPVCPRCREEIEPVSSSFYSLVDDRYQAARIWQRRFCRTAISRRRGAAEEEQLFTLTVVGERMGTDLLDEHGGIVTEITTLQGRVWVSDDNVEAMQSALRQVERIGAARSRGLGRVATIKVSQVPATKDRSDTVLFLEQAIAGRFILPPDLQQQEDAGTPLRPPSLAGRLIAFNVRFQAEQDFYAKLAVPLPEKRWYFTINLLSDAILTDQGLPTLRLTPERMGLVGNGLPSVKLAQSFVGRAYRSGWSGAYSLPHQVRLAVPMGGVYLYSVEGNSREQISQLLQRLEKIEHDGLGLDRERGYGQVMVCLPFHLEVEGR